MTELDYPKTAKEWWEWVDKYWDDFLYILCKYIPMHEQAREDYLSKTPKFLGRTIIDDIIRCKKNKDVRLERYFQMAWHLAPNNIEIHSNPNWSRFCDMCSEAEVLLEEGTKR